MLHETPRTTPHGVTVERTPHYYDKYTGTAEALIAAGLVTADQLPGMPGRGARRATIRADGWTPGGKVRRHGKGPGRFLPGHRVIRKVGVDRYVVELTVDSDEWERRRAAIGRAKCEQRQAPALTSQRRIRSRDDLSFTKRDARGGLINWFMPDRETGSWHQHYGIGEAWFDEIVELARHDPEEAYNALRFAGPQLVRYWNSGHTDGFFDRMARWAIASILASSSEPQLPFSLPHSGVLPQEGLDAILAVSDVPSIRSSPNRLRVVWSEGRHV